MTNSTVTIDKVADLPDSLRQLFRTFGIVTAAQALEFIARWEGGELPPPAGIQPAELAQAHTVLRGINQICGADPEGTFPVPPPGVLAPEVAVRPIDPAERPGQPDTDPTIADGKFRPRE